MNNATTAENRANSGSVSMRLTIRSLTVVIGVSLLGGVAAAAVGGS